MARRKQRKSSKRAKRKKSKKRKTTKKSRKRVSRRKTTSKQCYNTFDCKNGQICDQRYGECVKPIIIKERSNEDQTLQLLRKMHQMNFMHNKPIHDFMYKKPMHDLMHDKSFADFGDKCNMNSDCKSGLYCDRTHGDVGRVGPRCNYK